LSAVFFFIAAICALAGAIGVVTLRDPFYSVLSLAFHLVSLAALFLLLRAEFVAAAQVVVYAGAVMVLYVFVVAYVGSGQALPSSGALRVLGPLFAIALVVELCIAMLGSALSGVKHDGAPYVHGFGTPQHIGTLFLTKYLFPFEAASILLLVAAVGAVVLARRRVGLDDATEPEAPEITTGQPGYVGTMAEGAGIRPAPHEEPLESEFGPIETATHHGHRGGW
jgi:NADH:ubiquinone oxidoreductase subunit 6 (subunit J)